MTPSLSLILPAYNEAAVIADAVAEADAALKLLARRYEIIVVDDGGADGTGDLVDRLRTNYPRLKLVRHGVNRGYGAALRSGFDAATGDLVAFTDSDCQFDLADLGRLIPHANSHPIVVGYRIDRQDPWRRKFFSWGYNVLVRTLLGTGVRDCDCALKVFRREALPLLLPESRGFFVNTEMLTKAHRHGLSVHQVGVKHRPRRGGVSKVTLGDIPKTLRTLLPFWWKHVVRGGPVVAMTAFKSQAA